MISPSQLKEIIVPYENRRPSSVSKVANDVRTRILTGGFPAGAELHEVSLSKEYKASRSTIRSALAEIEKEGLLTTLPNGRRRSAGFNSKSLQDLYEVRALMEGKAVENILKKDASENAEIIQQLMALAQANYHAPTGNDESSVQTRVSMDAQFHRHLIFCSGNAVLLQCWQSFEPVIWTTLHINARLTDSKKHLTEYKKHVLMVEQLAQKKPDSVSLFQQHIDASMKLALETLTLIQHTRTSANKEVDFNTPSQTGHQEGAKKKEGGERV